MILLHHSRLKDEGFVGADTIHKNPADIEKKVDCTKLPSRKGDDYIQPNKDLVDCFTVYCLETIYGTATHGRLLNFLYTPTLQYRRSQYRKTRCDETPLCKSSKGNPVECRYEQHKKYAFDATSTWPTEPPNTTHSTPTPSNCTSVLPVTASMPPCNSQEVTRTIKHDSSGTPVSSNCTCDQPDKSASDISADLVGGASARGGVKKVVVTILLLFYGIVQYNA